MDAVLAELPERALFPRTMPRYPNLWFLVDTSLAIRGEYLRAVRLVVAVLEEQMGLRDTFVDDVANPNLARLLGEPGEGADFQARVWPLAPFVDLQGAAGGHGHQVHARFYVSPLLKAGAARCGVNLDGSRREVFAIPASVHYEVSTEDPQHPYADHCPMCGITDDYRVHIDPASQDYCVKIHDPLGVEILLHGTLRGKAALDDEGRPVRSLASLSGPWTCVVRDDLKAEGEPRRLGRVLLLADR
jgi:hypothetical protein